MKSKLRQWLIDNKDLIKLSGVEKRAGITSGAINHWIKGRRDIYDEDIKKIIEVIKLIEYDKQGDIEPDRKAKRSQGKASDNGGLSDYDKIYYEIYGRLPKKS